MKKTLILLLALFVVSAAFAQLKPKHIIGSWSYKVVTDQGDMSGVFKFSEKEDKLTGEVLTNDGYTIPFTKIELKEGNNLYLELKTESDLITISVVVDGKTFKGTGSSYQGEAPITGEKKE